MSSETSTDPDALQPWHLFVFAGLVGATIVVYLARNQTPASVIFLSLTIFSAAGIGIAALRTFLPVANKDELSMITIVGGRTRAALEREKTLVLRSIKELEFDKAMGKVSDKDFAEMSARLRARAARLIMQVDVGATYREQIESELAKRLGRSTQGSASRGTAPHVEMATPRPDLKCESCGTVNEPDARFCKHCGASLEPTE